MKFVEIFVKIFVMKVLKGICENICQESVQRIVLPQENSPKKLGENEIDFQK